MKKTSVLFIFLSFAIISFAAKTYTLTLTVIDKVNSNPLPLTSVFMVSEKGKVMLGQTDVEAKLEIDGLIATSKTSQFTEKEKEVAVLLLQAVVKNIRNFKLRYSKSWFIGNENHGLKNYINKI